LSNRASSIWVNPGFSSTRIIMPHWTGVMVTSSPLNWNDQCVVKTLLARRSKYPT